MALTPVTAVPRSGCGPRIIEPAFEPKQLQPKMATLFLSLFLPYFLPLGKGLQTRA